MGIVIAVIVAYMALMLFIGWRASKSVKSSKDYLIGGRRFGVLLTSMAHPAAGLSGWLFTAWSAQVAGMGSCHDLVSKSAGDVPETTLVQISGDQRVAEIARMLSGDTSEASLAHAREMLAAAQA